MEVPGSITSRAYSITLFTQMASGLPNVRDGHTHVFLNVGKVVTVLSACLSVIDRQDGHLDLPRYIRENRNFRRTTHSRCQKRWIGIRRITIILIPIWFLFISIHWNKRFSTMNMIDQHMDHQRNPECQNNDPNGHSTVAQ